MKRLTTIILLLLGVNLLFARTEISFTPLASVCSTDSLTCDAIIDYQFSLATADPNNLSISHQLSQNGSVPAPDPFGHILGNYPNYYISGFYPIGTYQIHLEILDAFGNVRTAEMPFEVVDCVAPELFCINGFAVELEPIEPGTDANGDGIPDDLGIFLYAEQLIDTFYTFCGDSISLSINFDGDSVDINQEFLFIDCFYPYIFIVNIYIWGHAFNPYAVQPNGSLGGPNYNSCQSYIIIQDNIYYHCHQGVHNGSINGFIYTETEAALPGVEVSLSGNSHDQINTYEEGAYEFVNLELFYDYHITPYKNSNPKNGVTTLDIVLIQQHILGLNQLDSPYKLIAADVNNSKSVTTLDVIALRRLILNLDQEFTNVPSWRFIEASFEFPDPQNPWLTPFPEVITLNDLNGDAINQDFIAIKMGDVNASANPLE